MMDRSEIVRLIESDAVKDLHLHSFFSDGVLSPEELMERKRAEGCELIAITDHDGIDGSIIAVEKASEYGIKVLPGIEFDSNDALGKKLHILGYGIDLNCKELNETLAEVLSWRRERNDKLIDVFLEIGYEMTDDEIYSLRNGIYVGKPHFAKILVKHGLVANEGEAFSKILKKDERIRAIGKKTLSSKEVIDIIHQAGGIAVLAHPMEQLRKDEVFETFKPRLIALLDKFREYGIDGIECEHPSAGERQLKFLKEYAEKYSLLQTCGSDYHSDSTKRDFTIYYK